METKACTLLQGKERHKFSDVPMGTRASDLLQSKINLQALLA
jgi:hypothetical protein